jgi:hypothetical protein
MWIFVSGEVIMTRSVPITITVLLILLCDSISTAQTRIHGKKVLALNDLSFTAITPQDASLITETLRSNIILLDTFKVMDHFEMKNILNQMGYQQSSICDKPSCALEIGQLLGVDIVGTGSVSQFGNTYSIGVNLIDVRTGRTIKEVNEFFTGNSDKFIKRGVPLVASKLCGITKEKVKIRKKSIAWFWISGMLGVAITVPVTIILINNKDNISQLPDVIE